MGRPRKQVRAASFSVDAKMYKLLQDLSDQEKKPMSHFVNMKILLSVQTNPQHRLY